MKKIRIPTSNIPDLRYENPFESLTLETSNLKLASNSHDKENNDLSLSKKTSRSIRLELRREKAGRGGKVVTSLIGLEALSSDQCEHLLQSIKTRYATGGALKEGKMIIQGDLRDSLEGFLKEAGYRVVRAGG